MHLSIVVPVLNEAESLPTLYDEIIAVARHEGYQLDLIFIDDGSSDDSWAIIRRLSQSDPRVRGVKFRRNFGKAAALSAGFALAEGEMVMTLDADLQDDPQEIPRFIAETEKNLDVISGWKKVRHDPWHKVGPSRVFNWLVGALTGVKLHDHNCGMKCYRREAIQEVRLYGELHRFVPVLAAARGFRVGELVINHRVRKFGSSKYGFTRFVKGFLDLLTVKFLTGFGQRPQHVLGTLGLLCFLFGGLGLAWLAGEWIITRLPLFDLEPTNLHQRPAVIYSAALFLMGGQLMSVGFLAELFVAYHDPKMTNYSISDRTGNLKSTDSRASGGTGRDA